MDWRSESRYVSVHANSPQQSPPEAVWKFEVPQKARIKPRHIVVVVYSYGYAIIWSSCETSLANTQTIISSPERVQDAVNATSSHTHKLCQSPSTSSTSNLHDSLRPTSASRFIKLSITAPFAPRVVAAMGSLPSRHCG